MRALILSIAVAGQWTAFAQERALAPKPEWRRIGSSSVDLSLAGPATGPADSVWYSPDGAKLYARARSGRIWETSDFETWSASSSAEPPARAGRLRYIPSEANRLFLFGSNVYRSEDGGQAWTNLTAYRDRPIIGGPQNDLAISPASVEQVAVANDFGVWRSADAGLSWTSLNQTLPNLPIRRILSTPGRGSGARILIDGIGPAEWQPGGSKDWVAVSDARARREEEELAAFSSSLGVSLSAIGGSGDFRFAGGPDGRIWSSLDSGRSWRLSRAAGGGRVESIFVDAREPRIAVAALGGRGPHVLRTVNGGLYWDDLSANLSETPAYAIAADRSDGADAAIYAATERGVFLMRASLTAAGPSGTWTSLSDGLPPGRATDVRLDQTGNQLYVAIDGYGLFAAASPHRARTLRIVNAADFSVRAAAPGSLLSVLGGRVERAQTGQLKFPILASSASESQIQVPFEATASALALAIEAEGRSVTLPLQLESVAPAIFVDRDGAPMILDADSGLVLDAGRAAHSGARIQVLATGLGLTRPAWPSGLAAPLESPPQVAVPVQVWLDRVPLRVTRATLAPGYIGYYLVEAELPALVNAGPAELYVAAEGRESNRVRMYLEP